MRRDRNTDQETDEAEVGLAKDEPEFYDEPEYEDEFGDDFEEPDDDEYEEFDEEAEDGEDGFYGDDFYEEEAEDVDEVELLDAPEGESGTKKVPREPPWLRARALWATVLAQARGIELPGRPEVNLKRAGGVAAIVLVSLVVGVGAFLIGRSTGDDLEKARLEGETAGRQAGAIEGAAEGYAAGFRKGRERGFRKAYVPAYRTYYKRALEQAGLDVPASKEIDVPAP